MESINHGNVGFGCPPIRSVRPSASSSSSLPIMAESGAADNGGARDQSPQLDQQAVQQQQQHVVVCCNLEGTLLRSPSFFPYYLLIALEAGGPVRALLLLLLFPVTWLLHHALASPGSAIRLQVFVSTAGLPIAQILAVSRAVLPKFFLDDLHPSALKALRHVDHSDADAVVLSSHPKVFVHHFLSSHLRVRSVIAPDLLLSSDSSTCTGFLSPTPGLLDERKKLLALHSLLCAEAGTNRFKAPIGLFGFASSSPPSASSTRDRPPTAMHAHAQQKQKQQHLFLSLCKDIVFFPRNVDGFEFEDSTSSEHHAAKSQHLAPLVFHDGRLVLRPTPLTSLFVVLWMPIAIVLAIVRLSIGLLLPAELAYPITSLLGVKLRVKGAPPLLEAAAGSQKQGVLFVCTHRSLADPIFLTMALRRKVRALAYSVSKVSELVVPIKATRLTRNREEDAKIIDRLLSKEDLFVCPEGTTCREPFLLRFSPLFADLADRIVPVALRSSMTMFHGTSARGYKFLDGFFLLMNPKPYYEVMFLEPLPIGQMREGGRMTNIDIANRVQALLADALGYKCTNFSRRDKYTLLAGHDGKVVDH